MIRIFKNGSGHARLDTPIGSVGCFIGRTNYLKGRYGVGDKGIEFHTSLTGSWRLWRFLPSILFDWNFGFGKSFRTAWDWSGSQVKPRAGWTLRILGFGFGGRTPKFIQRWLNTRDIKKWEAEESQYEDNSPEPPIGYYEEEDEGDCGMYGI